MRAATKKFADGYAARDFAGVRGAQCRTLRGTRRDAAAFAVPAVSARDRGELSTFSRQRIIFQWIDDFY
ncbi:hypothetical protein [Burkholderia pseudomultivorans]|uniref:hypothetical protein n=1 Tax=Burkholderia pseudomultivorans TaxID=1207504 RepID=UPI00158A423D|nr:hypothetical protein [Burkholderia pseudomultivorans]